MFLPRDTFRVRTQWLRSLGLSVLMIFFWAATGNSQTEMTIYNFGTTQPAYPYSGPTMDSAGNLYGASYFGATVYELSHSSGSWQETTLYTFTSATGGFLARPTVGPDGNLYGVSGGGGTYGQGIVYKLTRTKSGSWQESTLYNFTGGADGSAPAANLVFDRAGNLYGSTSVGGDVNNPNCQNTQPSGCGTVFELSPVANGKWRFHLLFKFNGDGNGPVFLAFNNAGELFGSSSGAWGGFEGPPAPGNIFKLTPTATGLWKFSNVYNFAYGDGGNPGNIFFDIHGNIYGIALNDGLINCESGIGPNGCGEVFRLTLNANGSYTLSVVYAFTGGSDGADPEGLVAWHGILYGVTFDGGSAFESAGKGVIFQLTPAADGNYTETTIHTFAGSDGQAPDCIPVVDSSGNLYGSTLYGGANGTGVAWEYTP